MTWLPASQAPTDGTVVLVATTEVRKSMCACGKPVLLVKSQTGREYALDPKPSRYAPILVRDGIAYNRRNINWQPGELFYDPHSAMCPAALRDRLQKGAPT